MIRNVFPCALDGLVQIPKHAPVMGRAVAQMFVHAKRNIAAHNANALQDTVD